MLFQTSTPLFTMKGPQLNPFFKFFSSVSSIFHCIKKSALTVRGPLHVQCTAFQYVDMLWFFFWLRNSFQICVKSAKQEKRPGSSEQRLILIPYFLFLWHLYLYFHLYFLSLRQKLVREDKWSAHLPNIASQFVFVVF